MVAQEVRSAVQGVVLPPVCMGACMVLRFGRDFRFAERMRVEIRKKHGIESKVVGKTTAKVIVPLKLGKRFPIGRYMAKFRRTTLEMEVKECASPGMALAFCDDYGRPLACYDTEGDGVTTFSSSSIRWKSNVTPLCQLAIVKDGCGTASISHVRLLWDKTDKTVLVKREKAEQHSCHDRVVDHLLDRLDGEAKGPYAVGIAGPS